MELLYLWEYRVRTTSKVKMIKLPCGFLGVREALPYIPHPEGISVMGQKCITLQPSASGAAVLPKEMHKRSRLLATATHPP